MLHHRLNKTIFFLCSTLYISTAQAIEVTIPNLPSGYEFTASILYLKPGADNLGWAVVTDFLPVTTPTWHVQTMKPGYEFGFNLGTRYIFPNSGTDVQLNWSHLNTHDTSNVAVDPSTRPTRQWISPFSQTGTAPEGGEVTGIASLKVANAKLSFNYDVVNLDVGKFIDFGSNMRTRFFSGLSGVRIKEKLRSTFQGLPLPILSFDNTSSYTGIGPRLGFNNSYNVYSHFSLVCQLAGAVFAGNMQPAEYKFKGSSAALTAVGISVNNEEIGSSNVTQLVPSLDAKIGVNYNLDFSSNSSLTFELGYMGAVYINPLSSYETNTNVLALDSGSLSSSTIKHTQSNFSVGGPYFTANWRF